MWFRLFGNIVVLDNKSTAPPLQAAVSSEMSTRHRCNERATG
jgi:hypothetical protein